MPGVSSYVESLVRSAFTRQQAEGHVQTVMEMMQNECASKQDLIHVAETLTSAFNSLRWEMRIWMLLSVCLFAFVLNDLGVVKRDVAVLKTDVAEIKRDVTELKHDVSEIKNAIFEMRKDMRGRR